MMDRRSLLAGLDEAFMRVPFGTKLAEEDVRAVQEKALAFTAKAFDVLTPGKTYRQAFKDLLRVFKVPQKACTLISKRIAVAEKKQRTSRRRAEKATGAMLRKYVVKA